MGRFSLHYLGAYKRISAEMKGMFWFKQSHLLEFVFFLSRSECEERKAMWDSCVAKMKDDSDVKEAFEEQLSTAWISWGKFPHTIIVCI